MVAYIDIPTDAARVLSVLLAGGIAIIPSSVGYGIVATESTALQRIYTVKRRQPHKRHAIIGSYALHRETHVLPPDKMDLVRLLTVDLNLPLGVIAPYRRDHPLIARLDEETLAASSMDGTMAMLVNGGPFQEGLVRVAAAGGRAVLGSSANLTGQGTKTVVEEIEPEIREAADIVVDYGRVRDGWPRASSTMVDFESMRVVRVGACYEVIRDVVQRFAGVQWPDPSVR
jgi:tRNA A37 threonylcarbamoyladenosine synthetase subunit TsaC/SUA5/YrdC